MACLITIEDATITDLALMSIEVTGTAVDCDSVVVGLSCFDSTGPFDEVTVPVVGGAWTALFPDGAAAGCSCEGVEQISVFAVARCRDDPNCEVTPDPFKKGVKCPSRCPTVVLTEPELTPTAVCNADGTVSVTLKAEVANDTGGLAVVHIDCGPGGVPDGTIVTPIPDGTGATITQVCTYPTPVTPEPFVVIDLPDGCPTVPIDVAHQICCPDPAEIEVTPGECVGGKRRVTIDLGGDFTGTIDFGDGVSLVFSGSVLSHDYEVPPTSRTITIEVAFCEDIAIEVDGLEPCAPAGACCLPDGTCEVLEESECASRGGVYQGDDVACDDVVCPPPTPTGACCLPDGTCAEHTQAECEILSGRYLGDGTSCAVDNQVGACCLPDDSCEELTRCECLDRGGTFKGVGVRCDEIECITDNGSCFDSIGAFICCLLYGFLLILIAAFIGQVVAAFCPFPPNTTLILTAAATLGAILLLLLLLLLCSWSSCRIWRALIWIFEWTAIACLIAFFFCMNAVLLIVAFGFGVLAGLLFLIRRNCGWPKLLRLP